MRRDRVEVICPCCSARLTVERASGEVLSHERPRRAGAGSLQDALRALDDEAHRRDRDFDRAMRRERRSRDLLDKKFEEARRKAKDDPGKPFNPLDFD